MAYFLWNESRNIQGIISICLKLNASPQISTKLDVKSNDIANCNPNALMPRLMGLNPKFYILNSINNQKENSSSGGVEATITKKSRIVRLSISPSQGDDPGFESRPEHPYM